jgi:hypothetical protein
MASTKDVSEGRYSLNSPVTIHCLQTYSRYGDPPPETSPFCVGNNTFLNSDVLNAHTNILSRSYIHVEAGLTRPF